jgi:hypothetical protein
MAAKTGTYTLINSTTLTTSALTVALSSIPATYTDLVCIVSARTDRSGQATDGLNVKINTDDGNNYSSTHMTGDGSTAASSREVSSSRWLTQSANLPGATATSGIYSSIILHFEDYANTTTYKSMIGRFDLATSITGASVGLWRNTAAISTLTFISRNNANFVSGSTFKLYGIEAGNL